MQYFEDIEIGAKASFGSYQVMREEVVAFAGKYDPQPFHLSDEAAAQTHFGRLSASGWHSCAMMMSMIAKHYNEIEHAGLGSPGVDEIRWLKPVFPGDTLRCETEVIDKKPSRSRPEMGSFRSRITIFNQDDVPVMSMISLGLIQRRPAQ